MTDPLSNHRTFWDGHARRDPLWAILSDPSKSGRRWELPQFLETGRREISLLMYQLRALGIEVRRGAALDFGCGVGRLTQPLARYFDHVVGVDISPEMIRLANEINQQPGRVRYVCNDRDDLAVLPSGGFSFMYSNVVLQHLEPALAMRYLEELFRVVGPGGLLVFQLPSHQRPQDQLAQSPRPMPEEAYRASVRADGAVPREASPGQTLILAVAVTNDSPHVWERDAAGEIRVGNHWLSASGERMLIQDDGRTGLPARLQPGETCRVTVAVTTPNDPGTYQLEIDAVHEGISWFADKGSTSARHDLQVGGAHEPELPAAASASVDLEPLRLADYSAVAEAGELPMHGVNREEVEALIRRSGATLVHLEPDERGGREWIGYRYFVRK